VSAGRGFFGRAAFGERLRTAVERGPALRYKLFADEAMRSAVVSCEGAAV
jgi:hypothetical protein